MKGLTPRAPSITVYTSVALAVWITVSAGGCSSVFKTQTVVHRGEEVTVALEEMIDWSFEASHPVKFDTDVLRRALEGVRDKSNETGRAYSPKDVEYLAPLLVQAFAKARPEDLVVFHLRTPDRDGNGVTGGTLYVKGSALYLTPLMSRSAGTAAMPFGRSGKLLASRSTGMWEFEPPLAARTQSAPTDIGLGDSRLTSVVIDHVALAKLPAETPARQPGPSSSPTTVSKDSPASPPAAAVFDSAAPTPTTGRAVPAEAKKAATVTTPSSPSTSSRTTSVKSESSAKKASTKKASGKSGVKKSKASAKKAKAPAKPKSTVSDSHKAILEVLQKDSTQPLITPTK